MTDDESDMTSQQTDIETRVKEYYAEHENSVLPVCLSRQKLHKTILGLRKGCAPGKDGITAEQLAFGCSALLVNHLAALYTAILSRHIVPTCFRTGIIIPLLKKPTLNPNSPNSYRPITLGSTFAKLAELLVTPRDFD
ncbi:uncharacterized protein LOC135486751 [Lineus longissimus]|uniref:uncharacterized protein LOC135486751 n=1 Tax=Lineus longissimus TaxID=88925 RepID=UPI00315D7327